MSTSITPPYSWAINFGKDNNLAINASSQWSEWTKIDSLEGYGVYFMTAMPLSETIPAGTVLYNSFEVQIKDYEENPQTSRHTGHYAQVCAHHNYYDSIKYYDWFDGPQPKISGNGYFRLEGQVTTLYEGTYAVVSFQLVDMKASFRYRRFRLVKV